MRNFEYFEELQILWRASYAVKYIEFLMKYFGLNEQFRHWWTIFQIWTYFPFQVLKLHVKMVKEEIKMGRKQKNRFSFYGKLL